jgi:hypothetical protein
MKCIECGTHSRLRERPDGRCPRCGHRFAFEPTTDPTGITDDQFKHAIERLSAGGTVRFTERNLWYEVHRRWATPVWWHTKSLASVLGPAVLGALPGLVAAKFVGVSALYWLSPVGAVAAGVVSAYRIWRYNRRPLPPPQAPRVASGVFRTQHLPRWIEVNGPIPGLLPPRDQAAASTPREVPADVAAFSFDRAVVTERWETAQVLVANRFHFEHNCAVLSLDGYPDGIAGTIRDMLRRNPRLTVFALHDASVEGCHLPLRLRDAEWFPDPRVRIVDLGLRPEIARRLRLPPLHGPVAYRPGLERLLSPEEYKWFAGGHSSELAALRPAQLLRAVYRGIVAAGPHDGSASGGVDRGGGGDTYYDGGVIWIGDGAQGGDTAAVDGFG